MNPLRTVCLLMGILALACANSVPKPMAWKSNRNSIKNSLKPTNWLSVSELESLPALNEVTMEKLESMSVQEGADLLKKLYHLAQISDNFEPSFAPKPSDIPAYLITPDNQKINFKLKDLPTIAKQQEHFGDQEVTIFITGLPQNTETTKKATRRLVHAYMQRYNGQGQGQRFEFEDKTSLRKNDNMREYYSDKPSGNLVVIDLGSAIPNFEDYATLDIEETGVAIGKVLAKFTDEANVPQEIVHVIGSNVGAHIAGVACRQYTRETGHQVRHITGLNPSKIYAIPEHTLTGLARGDAEFVDCIHTSALGMGTRHRCGDADFYVNGVSETVPGANNVVQAAERAVLYYAESVVPGNERNFPAVGATSLKEYKEQNGYGKRVYMGINIDYDVEGDFVLQVNPQSPFGRSTPAQKQQGYHNIHKPWKMSSETF